MIEAESDRIEPEIAITLDFNVKSGSVIKTTSVLREPSVEKNFELRRSAKFSSRESSVIKEPSVIKETKAIKESSVIKDSVVIKDSSVIKSADEADKLHTLKYQSGVLSNKSAQTPNPDTTPKPEVTETDFPVHTPLSTLNPPSDLPFIDEEELELEEAIRDSGLDLDNVVSSIQLASPSNSYSNASTLLISQRSCSGTDTIHMSEKVIKRDYRDL